MVTQDQIQDVAGGKTNINENKFIWLDTIDDSLEIKQNSFLYYTYPP